MKNIPIKNAMNKYNSILRFAKSNDCTACMACLDVCSHKAISHTIDRNGFIRMSVDTYICTNCGACRLVCPGLNDADYGKSEMAKAYAAWNNNDKQRQASASGGVFAALATYVLECGGVVYGAAIDGFKVKHIRIDKSENLHLLQNSKYQHSVTEGIYKQIKQDLKIGKTVLFSGLGCQVAAVYAFLREQRCDNLYTIDTICGGLSTMLPMISLAESGKYKSIISFRDKTNGWKANGFTYSLKLKEKNDKIKDLGNQNLTLKCFSAKITKRSSCLDCPFVGIFRRSDLTIGDFWGDSDFTSQHIKGLSAIIVHSARILKLLRHANLSLKEVEIGKVASGNPNLYFGDFKGVRRLISRCLALFFLRKGLCHWAWPLVDYDSMFSLEMRLYGMLSQKRIDAKKSSLLKYLNK